MLLIILFTNCTSPVVRQLAISKDRTHILKVQLLWCNSMKIIGLLLLLGGLVPEFLAMVQAFLREIQLLKENFIDLLLSFSSFSFCQSSLKDEYDPQWFQLFLMWTQNERPNFAYQLASRPLYLSQHFSHIYFPSPNFMKWQQDPKEE